MLHYIATINWEQVIRKDVYFYRQIASYTTGIKASLQPSFLSLTKGAISPLTFKAKHNTYILGRSSTINVGRISKSELVQP